METKNNGVEQELPNGDSAGEDTCTLARNQERKDEPICNPEITEDYGPWMLAPRRSRKPQPKQADANILEIRYDKGKGKIHQSNANISLTPEDVGYCRRCILFGLFSILAVIILYQCFTGYFRCEYYSYK